MLCVYTSVVSCNWQPDPFPRLFMSLHFHFICCWCGCFRELRDSIHSTAWEHMNGTDKFNPPPPRKRVNVNQWAYLTATRRGVPLGKDAALQNSQFIWCERHPRNIANDCRIGMKTLTMMLIQLTATAASGGGGSVEESELWYVYEAMKLDTRAIHAQANIMLQLNLFCPNIDEQKKKNTMRWTDKKRKKKTDGIVMKRSPWWAPRNDEQSVEY